MPHRDRQDIGDFARGPFRPHGHIAMWGEGPVVHVDATGPFNVEAMQALGLAMSELFALHPLSGVFGDIVEFHCSVMCSPEVVAAYGGFLRKNTADGHTPAAVAWVVAPQVEGRGIMLPVFQRLYAEHGRRFACFETMDEAQAWMRQCLREAGGGAA